MICSMSQISSSSSSSSSPSHNKEATQAINNARKKPEPLFDLNYPLPEAVEEQQFQTRSDVSDKGVIVIDSDSEAGNHDDLLQIINDEETNRGFVLQITGAFDVGFTNKRRKYTVEEKGKRIVDNYAEIDDPLELRLGLVPWDDRARAKAFGEASSSAFMASQEKTNR